jgi:glycogen debranching enzyme
MAERFRARFWVEDQTGPYPAIALQADGAPVDSLTSNIGHLLVTGILSAAEGELVAQRLLGPDLNSGFGLRTMAASSAGFNPLSYHCGSVWAHDTAIAITGLARTAGPTAREAALSLIEGLLGGAEAFGYRLPELYGGQSHQEQAAPLPYPASCHPQAWAAASSVAIMTALLGVRPDVPAGALALAPTTAGPGLRRVSGLRVGEAGVTIHLSRDGQARVAGCPPGLRVVG